MDRLQQLEEELASLKEAVFTLREEVTQLRQESRTGGIEALLSQRGLPLMAHGDRSQVLLSAAASQKDQDTFYQLMRRYSFRLFARDLIQFPQGRDLSLLSRYCSIKTVRSYLNILSELSIAEIRQDRSYRLLADHVTSFGSTLEWYVSEIFQREFTAPALFNARLRNTRYGGDYDVITIVSGYLFYVEVKSSPPRGVELEAVSAFLNRLQDLNPHITVFLVDTELRMYDKIVPLFAEALDQMGRRSEDWTVLRLVNEIFHVDHRIYLINSRKGIYSNLRFCLRDFLRWEKKMGLGVENAAIPDPR